VDAFASEVAKLESPSSKADTIAHRTKATIRARMDEDPAFYKKFSTMLEDAIAQFKADRISDLEYLRRAEDVQRHVVHHSGDDTPAEVRSSETQRSYFGLLRDTLGGVTENAPAARSLATKAAVDIDLALLQRRIVNWKQNPDVQNRMKTEIEDIVLDLANEHGIRIGFDEIDALLDQILRVAFRKMPD